MTSLTYGGRCFPVGPGQTVLDALEAGGVAPASSCRSGVCQSCLVRAVAGTIPARAQSGLSAGQKARGLLLACVAEPEDELVLVPLAGEDAPTPGTLVRREVRGNVLLLDVSAPDVSCLGGQFVHLIRPDGLSRPYSVAARHDDVLQFHVEVLPDGKLSTWLSQAPLGSPLMVRGPAGECVYVEEPDRPLSLAGLGTGLAPLVGILQDAEAAGHQAPIHLFVGARTAEDLYFREELSAWSRRPPSLEVTLGALHAGGDDSVRTGPLESAVLSDPARVAASRHYLCGAPSWVRGVRRRLFMAGASLQRIHADAFVTAPVQPAQVAR